MGNSVIISFKKNIVSHNVIVSYYLKKNALFFKRAMLLRIVFCQFYYSDVNGVFYHNINSQSHTSLFKLTNYNVLRRLIRWQLPSSLRLCHYLLTLVRIFDLFNPDFT